MNLELIIPCYREEERLSPCLRELVGAFQESRFRARFTIVDDGSGRESAERLLGVIAPIREEHPELFHEPVLLLDNVGKGGAVQAGWDAALARVPSPEVVGFVDADGATPAEEVVGLVRSLIEREEAVDAVFGSRIKMLGKRIDRHLRRHLLGRVFATLTHRLTGLEIYDSQCGAKLIRTGALRVIRPDLRETGYAFDVELCLLLQRAGFRVVEHPVSWSDTPGSRVRLLRDGWQMFTSLVSISRRLGRKQGAPASAN